MAFSEDRNLTLSIIIPVYNEQDTISEVIRKVESVDLGAMEKEIVVSDDGSTDTTLQIIERLCQQMPGIIVHTSPSNLGKGAAVRLGLTYATGDIVIIQDADLELDPAEYRKILDPIVRGEEKIVYGSRFLGHANRVPLRGRIANRFLTFLTNCLFGSRLTDMETAYKAFRRELITDIDLRCVRFDFEPEITAKFLLQGHTIHEVPISYNPRTEQEGKKISWIDGVEAIYTLIRCRLEV
jgi:glycosyltransferase involved in cell wall biosynthesis